MPDFPFLAAGSILVALVVYVLLGGADFGGGVWDLLARGPRAEKHRRLVARAIGPVWEVNHIWLVIAIVVLFTAFPPAYALLSTALFLPLSLLLAGIVVRGAAFAFHAYRLHDDRGAGRWGTVFAGASLATPILLGIVLGATASGRIRASDAPSFAGGPGVWLAPFPLCVGLLTLAAFTYLAAVYLILETDDPALREDFRRRGSWTGGLVVALSALALFAARDGAPDFFRALTGSAWSFPVLAANGAAAAGAAVFLGRRRYAAARACAAAQVTLLLLGFGRAQYPYLVRPDLPVPAAAASSAMLRPMVLALAAGAVVLIPAILFLLRVFKAESLFGRRNVPR